MLAEGQPSQALFGYSRQPKQKTHLRRRSSTIRSVACYSLRKRLDPLSCLQKRRGREL